MLTFTIQLKKSLYFSVLGRHTKEAHINGSVIGFVLYEARFGKPTIEFIPSKNLIELVEIERTDVFFFDDLSDAIDHNINLLKETKKIVTQDAE